MATYQVPAPSNFNFRQPEEWSKWLRRFERFRQTSDLDKKNDEKQINTLIYAMGDEADDILKSFDLSESDSKKHSCADVGVLCAILSLRLKARFYASHVFIPKETIYAMLVIKYLMASFYATVSGVKGIMISTHKALHKGKILCQPINL